MKLIYIAGSLLHITDLLPNEFSFVPQTHVAGEIDTVESSLGLHPKEVKRATHRIDVKDPTVVLDRIINEVYNSLSSVDVKERIEDKIEHVRECGKLSTTFFLVDDLSWRFILSTIEFAELNLQTDDTDAWIEFHRVVRVTLEQLATSYAKGFVTEYVSQHYDEYMPTPLTSNEDVGIEIIQRVRANNFKIEWGSASDIVLTFNTDYVVTRGSEAHERLRHEIEELFHGYFILMDINKEDKTFTSMAVTNKLSLGEIKTFGLPVQLMPVKTAPLGKASNIAAVLQTDSYKLSDPTAIAKYQRHSDMELKETDLPIDPDFYLIYEMSDIQDIRLDDFKLVWCKADEIYLTFKTSIPVKHQDSDTCYGIFQLLMSVFGNVLAFEDIYRISEADLELDCVELGSFLTLSQTELIGLRVEDKSVIGEASTAAKKKESINKRKLAKPSAIGQEDVPPFTADFHLIHDDIVFNDFNIVWYSDDHAYLQFSTSENIDPESTVGIRFTDTIREKFKGTLDIGEVTSDDVLNQMSIKSQLTLDDAKNIGIQVYDES